MNTDRRTNEQLNRIIAEWMGWSFTPEHDVGFQTPAGMVAPESWSDPDEETFYSCPSFCTDLNAIHEAEKNLGNAILGSDYDKFEIQLAEVCYLEGKRRNMINATARQRAEALVKIIECDNQKQNI